MKSEDSDTETGASAETEPEKEQVTEQKPVSFQDELLKVAKEQGAILPTATTEAPPEGTDVEEEPEEDETGEVKATEEAETAEEAETTEETTEEELKPAAKDDRLVPLSEVLEERAKKRRANERAEKAEGRMAELEAQVARLSGPQPTQQNPLIDLQDDASIDRVENSYETALEVAERLLAEPWEDEYGEKITSKSVVVGKDDKGQETRKDLTHGELVQIRIKADRALRKDIPARRDFLRVRAQADAQAIDAYPQLTDQTSDFTKNAAVLVNSIVTGRAANDPELLFWVSHALAGREEYVRRNGKAVAKTSNPDVTKRIVESSKTKLAPTSVKTRSFVRRGSSSDLAKAKTELAQKKTVEAAEDYVAAVFSQREGGARKLERAGE